MTVLLPLLAIAFLLTTLVIHIALAAGVYRAASHLAWCDEQVWFMPPVLWMLAALLTGLIATTAYWLIHHSSLHAPRRDEADQPSLADA